MLKYCFNVNNTIIKPKTIPMIIGSEVDYVQCVFEKFSSDWDDVSNVRVLFKNQSFNITKDTNLEEDGSCLMPSEILQHPGVISMMVYGNNGEKYTHSIDMFASPNPDIRSTGLFVKTPAGLPKFSERTKSVISTADQSTYELFMEEMQSYINDVISTRVRDVVVNNSSVVSDGVASFSVPVVGIEGSGAGAGGLVQLTKADGSEFLAVTVNSLFSKINPYWLPDASTSEKGAMSASDKTKLDGIASGAEVNVQVDWNESNSSSDAFIKNKPTIHDIPSGGTLGQALVKSSNSDYAVEWSDIGSENVQSDWDQADTTADDYIKNKPTNFAGGSPSSVNNKAGFVPKPPTLAESGQWHLLSDYGWIEAYPQSDSRIPWASKYSPTLTGTPRSTTPASGDDSTRIATTEFVNDAIDDISDYTPTSGSTAGVRGLVPSPGGGHTTTDDVRVFSDEGWVNLASYLNGSSKYPPKSYVVADALALKAPLASPAFTGTPIAPTPTSGDDSTKIATTAFVQDAISGLGTVDDVQVDGTSVVSNGTASINTMTGATTSADGTKGLVPAPSAYSGAGGYTPSSKVLTAAGAWERLSFGTSVDQLSALYYTMKIGNATAALFNIPYVTTSKAGVMSAADKTKLDSITLINGVIDASCLPVWNGGVV